MYGRPLMLMNPYCYFETQVVTCFFLGKLLAKKDVLMGGVVKEWSSYGMVSISLGIVSIPSAESCGIRISSRVVKSAVVEAESQNVIEIDHYGGFSYPTS